MTNPLADVAGPRSVPLSQIAHAYAIQLTCRAFGMLASVVSVAMTARYLGPGLYGQFTIAVVFIGMWLSLTDLGVGTVIVRRVTSDPEGLERLVRVNSGLSLLYCVPLAAAAAISGLLIYHDRDVRVMLVVLSGQLLMMTVTKRFEPVFVATVRFSAVAISDVVSRLATLAMVAYLVATRAEVIWFAVAQLIPPAVQLLIQGTAAAQRISLRPIFAPREALDLLRESLPLMGVLVIAIVYWRADGVILSLLSTDSEVGVYGLAYTIAFNIEVLSIFFLKSTLSTTTELFSRDIGAFAGFLRRSVELMYFLVVPVAAIGALLAGPLVEFFGDRAFVERGTMTLSLLFVAVALRCVADALGQGLFAAHEQKFFFRMWLFTLLLNIALNLALAGKFGAVGTGVTLVCTEIFSMVSSSWWLRRRCGYRTPLRFLFRVFVPTAASAGTVLLLSGHQVVLVLGVAAVVYLAVNMAIGPVSWPMLTSLTRKKMPA
ncbi:teichoic acid transporter [Mycobacterium vulneris]|uniref:Teichoic acid transporter n=1 Tax=Mycolicibacterium vulneris TaxID=547163 RepID=A0A1X2L4D2_9MYCO|nr:oligosaccharide flippase family protein [Mycolicibacterium vulneris]OSC28851.1 teichoic acid transporter [Mycolicibacterium vulneris]